MPELHRLLDVIIVLDISKEECWRRRVGRARGMAHMPPGIGDADTNYEVPQTYTLTGEDLNGLQVEAQKTCNADGDLACLRFYFEDVLWPAAERHPSAALGGGTGAKSTLRVLRLDGANPPSQEAWLAEHLQAIVTFVTGDGHVPAPLNQKQSFQADEAPICTQQS